MPNLDDFYAFKSTSAGHGAGGSGRGSGFGCMTVIVVLAILGWILKLFGG